MENNVLCTTYVLNFARKVGAKRVIYSGSSSVVGNGDGPTSPYGLQKLISEMECELYSSLYGLDTVSLRYFNVYSPKQKAEGPYATAIANFMQFIRDEKNPFITGNGEQRRDMANLKDVVSANVFAMEYNGKFNGRHFDVGTGANLSLNEIKNIVLDYFPNVKFEYVEERKGDVLYTKADLSPLIELGWSSKIKVTDGISECFAKLKEELK
jgi:nucleoside-diphosphate-sugar epimerase